MICTLRYDRRVHPSNIKRATSQKPVDHQCPNKRRSSTLHYSLMDRTSKRLYNNVLMIESRYDRLGYPAVESEVA